MKNNKGFTLVELLATLVVLGIIMAIAVPNVVSVVQKNRQKNLIEDGKKMISLAQYYVSKNNPPSGPLKLSVIDLSEDLTDGPNGGKYDREKSYVQYNSTSAEYTVYLYEYDNTTCQSAIPGLTESQLYDDTANVIKKLSNTCS